MNHRITNQVEKWIDEAIDSYPGSNIVWEPALVADPTSGVPTYTVLVWLPGAVLGTLAQGSFQVYNPINLDESIFKKMVHEFLVQLIQARAQQVTQQAVSAPTRGSQTASGLFIG